MSLYKYVPPERIDILTNGFVRFTQPRAFNDPFETFPCFTAGMPDEYIRDFLTNHEPDKLEQEQMLRASIEAEMSKYPGLKVPFEAIKDLPFVKAALNQLYPMAANLFTQFMSASGDLFHPLTIKIVLETINKQFGALCLAESPRNLLMWAHYSASHSGFLLEFDENHSFFDRRVKTKELARYLKKVHYTRARPQTVLFDPRLKKDDYRDAWVTSIFFSKSEHWAYEEEWRMVEYLKECKHVVRSEPYDIYLFPVPMGCITGVIFGCKMLDTTKSIIKHLVRTDPNCSHIRLSEATIDEKEYRLNISAVT